MIAPAAAERFRAVCAAASRFVLVTHINPDGDAIGSQNSLASYLRSLGKTVRVVNQDPTPETLRFIDLPELSVECYDPARHDGVLREAERLVLVDNSAPDRLGRMEPILLASAGRTLCIDHHPSRDAPWGVGIVDEQYAATTALIYDLVRSCGWQPDPLAALAIYVGLATDTGFFRFNSTNARAHEVAAELLRLGVEPAAVYREIHERNSESYVRLLGHALSGLRLDGGGAVAAVEISQRLVADLGAEAVDPTEILTELLALDGVRVALLFRELGPMRTKVSLRSKGNLDVHRLAAEFGGGGHRNASGIVMSAALAEAARRVTQRAAELVA